jgi:hypothetical protein
VVSWLGAVQAQDYPGAKWALGLRMQNAADTAIDRAFAAGEIVRTHVLRPTWHFVAPADIRWMLALTAPRVRAAMAPYDRRIEIDASVVKRSNTAIAAALRGGVQLTRQELKVALQRAGIAADGVQRLAHLSMHAELDGVICSGALRGKQFTYALLDERVPATDTRDRDEALADLTRRYFTSRGPAQIQDFVWWSGLTVADARAGIAMARPHVASEIIDGKTYWFSPSSPPVPRARRAAHLLPLYDEYLIAYKDRSAALDAARWKAIVRWNAFSCAVTLDGLVIGGWTRTLTKDGVGISLEVPVPLARSELRLVTNAAQRLGAFLGRPLSSQSMRFSKPQRPES